jgi:integrase
MAVYRRVSTYWYKFTWHGESIRESTKQGNKRVAEQMEAAHKASLAKGEVGIREKKLSPRLREFLEGDFTAFNDSRFRDKPSTLAYYRFGLKAIMAYEQLADARLDELTAAKVNGFVAQLRESELQVATINRQLQVLRRAFKLAEEWGRTDRVLPRVRMLPGENRRERVLTADEEAAYLQAAEAVGDGILEAYERALEGIRATVRGEQPAKPSDPFLLRDMATLLLDCGLRPEEAFRLRWEQVKDGAIHIHTGKTASARRVVPLSERATALISLRHEQPVSEEWVFPSSTRSGHVEHFTLKKRHAEACDAAAVEQFSFYTFRHTCLTRWAAVIDPYTLAYLAGHSDFATTKRYVHPQPHLVLEAVERARVAQGGHKSGHKPTTAVSIKTVA